MNKWKLAGLLVGIGAGIALAGTMLWQRYRRKEEEEVDYCNLCEGSLRTQDAKNTSSKKKTRR